MYRLLLLLTGFAMAKPVNAQINESDTLKFQIRTSLTGNYQKGNVDVLTVRSKIDFTYLPLKDFVFKSQNNYLYQAFYSKKADNDIFSRNYLYYKPQNKIYPFAIAYISTNYRRKVYNRFFTGGGITWQAINTGKHALKFSASAVYERTKFNGTVYNYAAFDGAGKISLWRGTLYTGGWSYLFNKHLRLYYDAFYQPAFNNKNNYRTQFDIGADFPVWKGLSANIIYAFTHENLVIKNIKKEDKILSFGFAYYFKIKQL